MNMSRFLPLILLAAAFCVQAQRPDNGRRQQRGREQLIEYRHNFLAKDLDLSADQQTRFFALYDEMNERLEAMNDEYRDICRKVGSDSKLSDVALESYARRMFEQKKLESEVELDYFEKFKQILNPSQLARLKPAEMKIFRNLSKFHRSKRGPADEEQR